MCLLADLLGLPRADRQLEAKSNSLNLYESMSPRNELISAPTVTCAPVQDALREKADVIYENCFKCQRERCQPPPRAAPAEVCPNRNTSTSKTSPAEKVRSGEREAAANVAPGDASQSADEYEEMDGWMEVGEGKRPLHKAPEVHLHSFFLFNPFQTDLLFVFGLLFSS